MYILSLYQVVQLAALVSIVSKLATAVVHRYVTDSPEHVFVQMALVV